MRILLVLITVLALVLPSFSKEKGTYVAKKDRVVKKKKVKRKQVRYPVRVNPYGEEVKIKEMLKDIYE